MHSLSTRRRAALVVFVLAAAAGAVLVGQSPQAGTAADIVSRVKGQFAPDARIAVFTVQAEVKENTIELVGDVEQPSAKEALLKAFKDAGLANVVERSPSAGSRDGRQAARRRDGQCRRHEDEAVARVGAGQSAHHGHGREDAQERVGLVLRAVARQSLSRVDGAQPPRADDAGSGGRPRPRPARDRHVALRVRRERRRRMGRPFAISSSGTC